MTSEYDEFIQVDERGDLVNALDFLDSISRTLDPNPLNWKWCIIVMHNALQGALVCTLAGSAGTGVLRMHSLKRVLSWFDESRNDPGLRRPREYLADLITLYERAHDHNFMSEFGGSPIVTTCLQDEDVQRLCNLRNNYQHFTPKGWAIERIGLPRIMLNALGVIGMLLEHPANTHRFKRWETASIRHSVENLTDTFGAMPTSE